MKNKTKNIILLIVVIFFLLVTRTMFKEHNLKKTISACIVAEKQTSDNFDKDLVKKNCEKKIRESINR